MYVRKSPLSLVELQREFEALVRDQYDFLCRRAERLLGSPEEAADATQIGLINAWKRLSGFEGRSSLRTWLYSVVTNAALKLRARRGRGLKTIGVDFSAGGPDSLEPVEPGGGPEEGCIRKDTRRSIARCLRSLPRDQREIVVLRHLRGLDTAEAARRIGVKEITARVRLHRARLALMADVTDAFAAVG